MQRVLKARVTKKILENRSIRKKARTENKPKSNEQVVLYIPFSGVIMDDSDPSARGVDYGMLLVAAIFRREGSRYLSRVTIKLPSPRSKIVRPTLYNEGA